MSAEERAAEVAVEVCAASREHSAGHGWHDAHRYGPCSDHKRIVGETLTYLASHADTTDGLDLAAAALDEVEERVGQDFLRRLRMAARCSPSQVSAAGRCVVSDDARALAWDQGWRAAVAWMRLGASGDLPPNPYSTPEGADGADGES